jgi:kynurenine formamidase
MRDINDKTEEHLEKNKYMDLTLPITQLCALRGSIQTQVMYYQIPNTTHFGESILFSIHNATHIDLPWSVKWEESDRVPILGSEREEWENFYLQLKQFDCIVLERHLAGELITSSYIKSDIDSEIFIDLYSKLKITKEEIIKILEIENISDLFEKKSEDGIIVIFKTKWNEYYYAFGGPLCHPICEGWHAYLTHPFLSPETIDFLIEQGIAGVGCDTPSLENFMYYVNAESEDTLEYLRKAYYSIKREDNSFKDVIKPLHYNFLKNRRYLIENLCNLAEIETKEGGYALGKLLLIPYPITTDRIFSGTIVRALFKYI